MHDTNTNAHDSVDRSKRSGAWRAGNRCGEYVASTGRNDDYLELRLARGTFTGRRTATHFQCSGNLSIQRFGGGRGLAILRLTGSKQVDADTDEAWLGELVSLVRPVLPRLQLYQDAQPSAPADGRPISVEPDAGASAASADAPSRLVPWLPQAVAALERACFKEAERIGGLAAAADEPDATEFLEALRAIRRGARLVRRWPRDPVARLALAQVYFLADAGAAAVAEATEALRLDPTLGEAHALLGLEHLYHGQPDGARIAWEQARALAPTGAWQEALANALADERMPDRSTTTPPVTKSGRGWRTVVRGLVPLLKAQLPPGPWR